MHTDTVELTQYWKDKKKHQYFGDKIINDWQNKGMFYKKDADKYLKLTNKLMTYHYPTYQVLQPKGYYK